MRELLILRHAKSSWEEEGLDDRDRPLNRRGLRDAPRMGRLLREQDLVPDLILTSPANRAKTTAELVAEAAGFRGETHESEDLYLASPHTAIDVLRMLDGLGGRVMIVAHNPGLEELVRALTGRAERFPTAALAALRVPVDDWTAVQLGVRCDVIGLWRPKELPADH